MRYSYFWDKKKTMYAFTTTISVFINHSKNANTNILRDYEKNIETLYALKGIKKGEELTIDYVKLDYGQEISFTEHCPLFIENVNL